MVLVTLATLISDDFPLITPVAVSLALHLWLDCWRCDRRRKQRQLAAELTSI
jgi:hypothetical protein